MSDVLEQDEINALLNGVDSGVVDTAPRHTNDPPNAKAYDFSTQARVVRGRMPTLDAINDRLARYLRQSMLSMLRRVPEISVQEITLQKYGEYVQTLGVPTSLNQIRLLPLSGTGLLVFEAKLVSALIDVFFGGNGRPSTIEGRDFTPTETQLVEMLLKQVIAGAKEAWAPVMQVDIEFITRETNPIFANIVGPTEIMVISRLHVDFEGRGGDIQLTLPYSMLEPLKDTLRAGLQSERADTEEHWAQQFRDELEESDVDLVTRLGTSRMTFGELLNAKPGDVIPCDFNGHATVMSDGLTLFCGDLGQQGGKQVVRVTQISSRKSGNLLDGLARRMS